VLARYSGREMPYHAWLAGSVRSAADLYSEAPHSKVRLANLRPAPQQMNVMSIAFAKFLKSVVAAAALAVGRFARVSRPQQFLVLLATALVSSAAQSQNAQTTYSRMGQPTVLSAFGRPLLVKIPLEVTSQAIDSSASNFSLGARPQNADLPYLETGEITLERQGEKYFLVIRSRQAVDELAIGIVVREQLQNGVRSREFTILLDPAPIFEAAAVAAAAANAPVVTPPAATAIAPIPAAPSVVVPRAKRTKPAKPSPASPAAAKRRVSPGATATARSRPSATTPRTANSEPKLRLSMGVQDLAVPPQATEAMRAEMRRRQLILDTDDLTSALLERGHRITLLEKELAVLNARVSATERTLSGVPVGSIPVLTPSVAAPPPSAPPITASPSPVAVTTPNPVNDAVSTPVSSPAPATEIADAKVVKPPTTKSAGLSAYAFPIVLTLLAALVVAFLLVRRRMEHRDRSRRIALDEAEAYFAPAPEAAPVVESRPIETVARAIDEEIAAPTPAESMPEIPFPFDDMAASPSVDVPLELPEINFDLPPIAAPTAGRAMEPNQLLAGGLGSHFEAASHTTDRSKRLPGGGVRGRRLRYLESRYQDIAILKPRLDAPESLLNQANRLRDEGAHDYAKRLLKYAAYSRPQTEAFWVALLEALFQEKFRNDFVVNAKWFHEHHPHSTRWHEVQRFGHRIAPEEALFASATKRSEPTSTVFHSPPVAAAEPQATTPPLEFNLPSGWSKPMEDL
jgi:hypothetical protein